MFFLCAARTVHASLLTPDLVLLPLNPILLSLLLSLFTLDRPSDQDAGLAKS
jgi:hypothetical protein